MFLLIFLNWILFTTSCQSQNDMTTPAHYSTAAVSPAFDNATEDYNTHFNSNCTNITLGEGEYDLWTNGSVYIKKYELSLNESLYLLENSTLTFCGTDNQQDLRDPWSPCFLLVIMFIGVVALFIQFCVYCCVEDLRQLAFFSCAAVGVGVLFVSLICAILQFGENSSYFNGLWFLIPIYTHYFMLASFTWISAMSSEIYFMNIDHAIRKRQRARRIYFSGMTAQHTAIAPVSRFREMNIFVLWVAIVYVVSHLFLYSMTVRFTKDDSSQESDCWTVSITPSLTFFDLQVWFLLTYTTLMLILNTLYHEYTDHPGPHGTVYNDFKHFSQTLEEHHMVFIEISLVLFATWFIGSLASTFAISWMYFVFVFIHTVEVCSFVFCKRCFYEEPGKLLVHMDSPRTLEVTLNDCIGNEVCDV